MKDRKPVREKKYEGSTATSHHHLDNTQAVLSTLVHQANAVSENNSLPQELKFLQETFRNDSSEQQILHALTPPPRTEENTSVAFYSLVSTTFNFIRRLLSKHNIKPWDSHHGSSPILIIPLRMIWP
jgi:hypothetical protein